MGRGWGHMTKAERSIEMKRRRKVAKANRVKDRIQVRRAEGVPDDNFPEDEINDWLKENETYARGYVDGFRSGVKRVM